MGEINVRLRIVGLYFNETVTIEDKEELTVRDVLDKYISDHPDLSVPGGLEYVRYPIFSDRQDYVKAFNYHFNGSYNFDADGVSDGRKDGRSLGKSERKAGVYSLSEDLEDEFTTSNVGLAWQYYVVSKGGSVKSKTPASREFQPFGNREAALRYRLADEDTIIWRLVVIAREPSIVLEPAPII
jgi:hypothetical protein